MPRSTHLHYLGHSTVLLELHGHRVLTDPLLRPILGPLVRSGPAPGPATFADLDVVVVSHLHLDHLDVPSLARIPRGATLVVPRGGAGLLARTHHHAIVEMVPGDALEIDGLTVRATEARHPGSRRPGGLQGIAMGYLLETAGSRLYFAGDTALFDGMAYLGEPDIALLPVGGWGLTRGRGHLDPRDAAEALRLIRPRVAVPIHWGTFWPRGLGAVRTGRRTGAGAAFARLAAEIAPGVRVLVAQPGHRVTLPGETHRRPADGPVAPALGPDR